MAKQLIKRQAGLACAALTLAGAQPASALDKYLDLEPPQTQSGYGYGYNSIAKQFILRQCVSFGKGVTDDGSGGGGEDMHFSRVTSNSQLADSMGLSVGVKFSASMGFASASASDKVGFFQSTKSNMLNETILASFSKVDPMAYIAGDISVKPEYVKLIGTPAFREQCGDYLVIGEQSGRWFYGTVSLVITDTSTESKLAQAGDAEASYATASLSVNESTVNTMKSASGSKDLEIQVTSSGTKTASLNINQFLNQVHNFPRENGAKELFKLKAVPYEDIVVNWPPQNPLAPLTDADKLDAIASAAFGFESLIEDSDFVLQNAKLFALGITKREARLQYIRARHAFYQQSLATIRKEAKGCDVDWKGTPACEQLYVKYRNFDDWMAHEYDQFPIRYTSDCSSPRTVELGGKMPKVINLDHVGGDTNFDGGPGAIAAYLNIFPEFTGGNRLAVRKLDATLELKVYEAKSDWTAWAQTSKVNGVVDLDDKALSLSTPMDQCSYQGSGVKAPPISLDTPACDILKQFARGSEAANAACKQKIGTKWEGMLFGATAQNPASFTYSHGKGLLNAITCNFKPADQGQPPICSNVSVPSVQLDLVNSRDIEADRWDAPKDPNADATPNGQNPDPKVSGNHKALTASKSKAKPSRTCKPGLVNERGNCVPVTKR
jgi:hypothetical protein